MSSEGPEQETKVGAAGEARWQRRDTVAAVLLAAASAGFTAWQNAHLTVLWDASYTLDTSTRIALGQMPYRDFPLAHAPLTFLIQALLIRLTGRVFWHAVAYAAAASGAATVLAWRVMLAKLRDRVPSAWTTSLLLAAPLAFLSVYSILPFPSYDCDCMLAVLVFLAFWVGEASEVSQGRCVRWKAFAAGALLAPPLFFKQNIGLSLAACAVAVVAVLLALRLWKRTAARVDFGALITFLAGAAAALAAALVAIEVTAGLNNYLQWTVRFAAQRRMPGLDAMVGIYREPALLWELPAIAAGLLLLRLKAAWRLWVRVAALALVAAPLVWTLAAQALGDDAEDRTTSLLALWPLLLILAVVLALFRFVRAPGMRTATPLLALAAIHGTMLSQQLWGSTYALWPLLVILLAEMIAAVHAVDRAAANRRWLAAAPVLAALVCVTLLVCGGLYATSEERLSYSDVVEGPLQHSAVPALRGMAVRGEYLPEFKELLDFAAEIPQSDGIILLPGEDPFYFATGRAPRFPVLLFDPATDPFAPAQLAAEARRRNIRWLVVKQHLQMREDPMPEREAALAALLGEFHPYRTLRGYAIYRRTE